MVQTEKTGEARVLVGATERKRRGDERVRSESLGQTVGQRRRPDGVRAEREVWPVLLGRAERQDYGAGPGPYGLSDPGPGHLGKPVSQSRAASGASCTLLRSSRAGLECEVALAFEWAVARSITLWLHLVLGEIGSAERLVMLTDAVRNNTASDGWPIEALTRVCTGTRTRLCSSLLLLESYPPVDVRLPSSRSNPGGIMTSFVVSS